MNRYTYIVSVEADSQLEAEAKIARGDTTGIHTLVATTDAELARKLNATPLPEAMRRFGP